MAPGNRLLGDHIHGRCEGGLTEPDMTRGRPQKVFGIAADIQSGVGMDPGLADDKQAGPDHAQIVGDHLKGLAVE